MAQLKVQKRVHQRVDCSAPSSVELLVDDWVVPMVALMAKRAGQMAGKTVVQKAQMLADRTADLRAEWMADLKEMWAC